MKNVLILHNPSCTKSRATLALLRDRNIEPRVVDYLNEPPSIEELTRIVRMLGTGARGLMRTQEPEYRELGLDDESLAENELIAAMHAHPRLIQRPIVVTRDKAAIGRPPEAVLEIL
ncbi:MAG: arsenate reductase (glutaredoxin) [Xanthomonadales bacterium]|nr:arsenate reductase (glutaredoxin) [Xanthomonadales bacterium]